MMTAYIGVRTDDGILVLHAKNLSYCLADGSYTDVVLKWGHTIKISHSIGHVESQLPKQFVRIHHSHIVNLTQMETLINSKSVSVIMRDGNELDVSRRRKKVLMDRLTII